MEDVQRASDEVTAIQTINSLRKLLNEARVEQRRWQVTFEVEIVQPNRDIKITARKLNGSGVIRTVPYAEIIYFKDDVPSLVQSIVEQVYNTLLKQQLINELAPKLTKAVQNCVG